VTTFEPLSPDKQRFLDALAKVLSRSEPNIDRWKVGNELRKLTPISEFGEPDEAAAMLRAWLGF
jgi:hypothetical protein